MEPIEFGPTKSLQIPHEWRLRAGLFKSIEKSWDVFREVKFGIPHWWANSIPQKSSPIPQKFSYTTATISLRENPDDLVDEMIRARQIQLERDTSQ